MSRSGGNNQPLVPREKQQATIDKMLTSPTNSALIAGDVGVGKSLITVEYCKAKEHKVILVVGPINTFRKSWKKAVEQQGLDLPVVQIKADNGHFEELRIGKPGVYFVGREFFAISGTELKPKADKKTGEVKPGRPMRYDWSKVKADVIVVDEVHSAANRKSRMFEVLKKMKHKYRVGLSGTWTGDRFEGAWSITRWLFPDHVDRSFWRWADTWAEVLPDRWAGKKVGDELEPGEFAKSLPCYVYLASEQPPHKPMRMLVELSGEQLQQYREAEKEAIVWVEDNPLVIQFPAVRRVRLRQMALGSMKIFEDSGLPYFDDDTVSAKLDIVEKYIRKFPEENILFVTSSYSFSEVAARRLGGVAWNGSTKQKTRDEYVDDFGKGNKYIVAVHRAIAEGTDGLQDNSHTLIMFDESDWNIINTQMIGRLNRHPQKHEVKVIYVQAKDTIDTGDFDKRAEKARAIAASIRVGK